MLLDLLNPRGSKCGASRLEIIDGCRGISRPLCNVHTNGTRCTPRNLVSVEIGYLCIQIGILQRIYFLLECAVNLRPISGTLPGANCFYGISSKSG